MVVTYTWKACYIYIYIYIYMKSSFPKRVKYHSKAWPCNVNAKFDYYVLEKSFTYMNKYTYMCYIMYYININRRSKTILLVVY